MTAYEQGFMAKCAEYGVPEDVAGEMLKQAAGLGSLVPVITRFGGKAWGSLKSLGGLGKQLGKQVYTAGKGIARNIGDVRRASNIRLDGIQRALGKGTITLDQATAASRRVGAQSMDQIGSVIRGGVSAAAPGIRDTGGKILRNRAFQTGAGAAAGGAAVGYLGRRMANKQQEQPA